MCKFIFVQCWHTKRHIQAASFLEIEKKNTCDDYSSYSGQKSHSHTSTHVRRNNVVHRVLCSLCTDIFQFVSSIFFFLFSFFFSRSFWMIFRQVLAVCEGGKSGHSTHIWLVMFTFSNVMYPPFAALTARQDNNEGFWFGGHSISSSINISILYIEQQPISRQKYMNNEEIKIDDLFHCGIRRCFFKNNKNLKETTDIRRQHIPFHGL